MSIEAVSGVKNYIVFLSFMCPVLLLINCCFSLFFSSRLLVPFPQYFFQLQIVDYYF